MSEWNRLDLRSGELALATAGRPTKRRLSEQPDPLAAVMSLGEREVRVGAVLGLAFALLTHGAASSRAFTSLHDLWTSMDTMRQVQHEFFWQEYDIDLTPKEKPPEVKPPEPPPPEPEPEPAPVPVAKVAAPVKEEDPYEPPPAPAQAAKVLTAPEDPQDEKIEDLTGDGFVSGEGTGPIGGYMSQQGTGNSPTFNPNAKVGGTPGGKGTGDPRPPPPPPPPGPDLSRAAGLVGSTSWNCPFPPEADAEQIDSATATVVVTVRPDGTPMSVKVTSDPGHGFGRAARICALGRRYNPALDRTGQPTTSTMPPITVRFSR